MVAGKERNDLGAAILLEPQTSIETRERDALLQLLSDLGQQFADAQDLDASLQAAVTESMRYIDAEAGSIFLIDETGTELQCAACGGPVEIRGLRLSAGEGVVGRVVATRRCELIRDVRQHPSFYDGVDAVTGFATRSILCAPLVVRGKLLGALELLNKRTEDGLFDEGDCRFLSVVASGVALAVENGRQAKAMVEKERLRHELVLARRIQSSLLPRPQPPQFPFHGINVSAREVSGDFFHWQRLDDGQYLFALGDVAGKGVHAALLMSRVVTLIQALAPFTPEPGALLGRLNEEVLAAGPRGFFVTLALGLYRSDSGSVRLSNAGHMPPLLRGMGGGCTPWVAEAPPLGVTAPVRFGESEFSLGRGMLCLYSDGLTEALAGSPERTGIDELCQILDRFAWVLPDQRVRAIAQQVAAAGMAPRDDLTLLILDGSTGGIEHLAEQEFPALPEHLAPLRQLTADALRQAGYPSQVVEEVTLALGEAAMNVVQHGFQGGSADGRIRLALYRNGDCLTARLTDNAPLFDPGSVQPRPIGVVKPGGLGLGLIRRLTDEAIYLPQADNQGNILEMHRRFGGGD